MEGPRFRELRLLIGLSQAKAGVLLGCSERTIRGMEQGRQEVRRAYGVALAAEHHHHSRQALLTAQAAESIAQRYLDDACNEDTPQ